MSRVRMAHRWVALVCVVSCTACIAPMPKAKRFAVSADDVIIVGKLEIDPPIDTEHEQKTHWNVLLDGGILNRVEVATGPDPAPVDSKQLRLSEWSDAIITKWGETFILRGDRAKTWLRGATMQLDSKSMRRVWFPGGVFYDPPSGATAVYIGTLRYSRDDFYAIRQMEIIDEYDEALQELRSALGSDVTMAKAMMRAE